MTSAPVTRSLVTPNVKDRRKRPRRSVGLRVGITFAGLLCAAIVTLVGLAALNSETNLLFLLVGVGIGIIIFNLVAAARMVTRIHVERLMPGAVVAGRPFKITYIVRNQRRWLRAWAVTVHETPPTTRGPRFPQGFVPVLEARDEERLELTGNCPHRGRIALRGVRISSRFPFGLFACSVDLPMPDELVVYPTIGRFRRDPWKDGRYTRSAATRGAGHDGHDEFYGIREYRPGDNYRWIHWRRSARTGELVVREMMPLRQTQLILMVDPWPGTHARGGRRAGEGVDLAAERVISGAATAVCEALERGHRVGLICRAHVPLVIAPAGGRAHRQRLLHQLAIISPNGHETLDRLVARIRWPAGWHARCMIWTSRLDETHDRVTRLLAGRTEATVALSPDSEGFDALLDFAGRAANHGRSP